jgi:hypothetical protein
MALKPWQTPAKLWQSSTVRKAQKTRVKSSCERDPMGVSWKGRAVVQVDIPKLKGQ